MKKWFEFFLSHSIFISICAVALCYQTTLLLQVKPNAGVFGFVFFSTLGSYNFYWLISKFSFARPVSVKAFLAKNAGYLYLLMLAGVGMAATFTQISFAYKWIAGAVLCTLLYSLPLWPVSWAHVLRKAGFLKTILLSFTWAYVTCLLPVFVEGFEIISAQILLLFATRFFFTLMLCLIFDERDAHIDKVHALHSLATDLGAKKTKVAMVSTFVLYITCGVVLRVLQQELWQLIAFAISGIAVWQVYRNSSKKQDYVFYYFVVDGLMLFTSLLTAMVYMIQDFTT